VSLCACHRRSELRNSAEGPLPRNIRFDAVTDYFTNTYAVRAHARL
jgi:hypothetical protein